MLEEEEAHLNSASKTHVGEALWPQIGSDHSKCEYTRDIDVLVSDQTACQQRAVQAKAPFYSYAERERRCFYSRSCDNPESGTTWPWKRYAEPVATMSTTGYGGVASRGIDGDANT